MGYFMDGGFQRLQVAHALLDGDSLFYQVIVAVAPAGDVLKRDRNGRNGLQCGEKVSILFHAASQLVHGDAGQGFSLGLRHIEHRHWLERLDYNFSFFGGSLVGRRVDTLYLAPDGVR